MPEIGYVSSSEIAGLFGVSPYTSKYLAWAYHKHGKKYDHGNERTRWGKLLQDDIIQATAEDLNLDVEPNAGDVFLRHVDPAIKAGCTVDCWIRRHAGGLGIIEVKNVDFLQWAQNWDDHTAPIDIELQVQHQLWVSGASWAIIGCLVGGNDLKKYERKRNEKVIAEIASTVEAFWQLVDSEQKPDPAGFEAEKSVIGELYGIPTPYLTLQAFDNFDLINMIAMLDDATEKRKFYASTEEGCKVKLLALAEKHDRIRTNGWSVGVSRNVNKNGVMSQRVTVKKVEGDPAPTFTVEIG